MKNNSDVFLNRDTIPSEIRSCLNNEKNKIKSLVFLGYHGSNLYETNSEKSDLDIKGVYFPYLDDILLNQIKETINFSTGNSSEKNTENDIDLELYSINKFINLLSNGNIVVWDMLMCPPNKQLIKDHEIWEYILKNAKLLINENLINVKHYARNQVAKYGFKGSRLGYLEELYSMLEIFQQEEKIICYYLKLKDLNEKHNNMFFEFIEDKNLFKFTDKCLNVKTKVKDVREFVKNNLLSKYGKRAEEAKCGIDYKAVSHAFRACYVVQELHEYFMSDSDVFPMYPLSSEKTKFLKDIKNKKIKYDSELEKYLSFEMDTLDKFLINFENKNKVQDKNNFILNLYKMFYF